MIFREEALILSEKQIAKIANLKRQKCINTIDNLALMVGFFGHFLGLNLSRAIGDHAYKTNKDLPLSDQMISPVPDVKKLTIDPEKDSFVLLACDGIWNSLSSQETVDFVNDRLKKSAKHDTNYLTNIIKEVSHENFK